MKTKVLHNAQHEMIGIDVEVRVINDFPDQLFQISFVYIFQPNVLSRTNKGSVYSFISYRDMVGSLFYIQFSSVTHRFKKFPVFHVYTN